MANKNFKARIGIEAPLIAADDGTTAITLTSANVAVAGNLDVQGGAITESTGALTISTGASNGNITLDPNGTGDIAFTLATGGNVTNTRNYVFGAIRNSTTENTNGDIWELNTGAAQSATNPYYRGISLDNSADQTRGPATLMRSYAGASGGGSAQRGRVIFEKSRGTNASPSAVQSGDNLGSIDATGYTSTGWLNDTVGAVPIFFGFSAAENWVSNTNLGTTFTLSQAPTATTITSGANLINTLVINPQTFASRSDAFTWANGKTGTTQTMALDVNGNLTVTGDLQINGNNILSSGATNALTLQAVTGFNSNTYADGNLVYGAIRNTSTGLTTTLTNGDMWSLTNGAAAGTRGLCIDNSVTPSKRPGIVTRAYSTGSGVAPRSMAVTEIARGNPTGGLSAVQTTDRFCEMTGQGYNGTNWTGDVVANNPFTFRAEATETWSDSPRRAGTKFMVFAQPSGVDYTTTSVSNIINHNPLGALYIADTFQFDTRTAASGGTAKNLLTLNNSGSIVKADSFTFQDSNSALLHGGDISYRRTYGCFHKTANVTAAAANTVYEFDWYTDTTAHVGNQGVTVTSGNPTRLNIDTQGSYEVVIEMQAKNTDNAERTAWVWLAKNGTDLSETRIKVSLRPASGGSDVYQLITKMWCVDNLADNDYLEVRFAVDNTSGISLEYEAAQTSPFVMPAQPSATITVSPIGA